MTKEEALSDLSARTKKAIDKAQKIKNPIYQSAMILSIKSSASAIHDVIIWNNSMYQAEQDLMLDTRMRSY